jgi:hypothetical protein
MFPCVLEQLKRLWSFAVLASRIEQLPDLQGLLRFAARAESRRIGFRHTVDNHNGDLSTQHVVRAGQQRQLSTVSDGGRVIIAPSDRNSHLTELRCHGVRSLGLRRRAVQRRQDDGRIGWGTGSGLRRQAVSTWHYAIRIAEFTVNVLYYDYLASIMPIG